MQEALSQRIEACEQQNRRLRQLVMLQGIVGLAIVLAAYAGVSRAGSDAPTASIKAREIVVVDANNVVRARMSGDMPNAVMAGGRVAARGTKAAGFMLYDEEGIERGGYVTMDSGSNAMLSLDSKHHMVAHMVVGPDKEEAAALRLGGQRRALELRTDDNGARLSIEAERKVVEQHPAIGTLQPETCKQQRAYEQQFPGRGICRTRYTAEACTRCLGEG